MASAKEIPPGGEGKIDVTFKVGSNAGKRQKTINVTTNDPDQKTVSLNVSADVKVVLNLEPARVNIGNIPKKTKTAPYYVSLTGSDADKVKISSIKSENQFIKVETNSKGFENDKNKKIKVTILPDIKVSRLREKVIVYTDHASVKELTFYVYGEVTGNINVTPKYLSLGTVGEGKPTEGKINVTARGDAKFKIVGVQSSMPEVEATVETVKKGKEYVVTARVKEDFTGDVIKGNLTIQTDDKEEDKIEVRVYGRKQTLPAKIEGQTPAAPQIAPPAPEQKK